ncbi:glycosyltransferase, partial [Chloroflexota bacterium]
MSIPSSSPADVKVSVHIITHNHEQFIAEAIESVLMQEADFTVELVIGEDCSTDGTRAIVLDYGDRYPQRIRALLHDRNLGPTLNFLHTLAACRGEYVALLDGDDYWTDPRKLQKQVDYLDRNRECAMCFHPVEVISGQPGPQASVHYPLERKPTYCLADWLRYTPALWLSMVFRRSLAEIPAWFHSMHFAHRPFGILLAQRGSCGYIDEIMGAYRSSGLGVYTSLGRYRQLQVTLQIRRELRAYLALDPRHLAILDEYMGIHQVELGMWEFLRGESATAGQTLDAALTQIPPGSPVWLEHVVHFAVSVAERQTGHATGQALVDWVAGHLAARGQRSTARTLWGKWYFAHAFQANRVNDRRAVRRFAWAALRSDPRMGEN